MTRSALLAAASALSAPAALLLAAPAFAQTAPDVGPAPASNDIAASLGRDSITVRVTGNDVALSGSVASPAHHDAAIAAAEAAPGVARVHDEITVGNARVS